MSIAMEKKSLDKPDEIRTFEKGTLEVVKLPQGVIGRATFQPGWKWSEHNAPIVGTAFCHAPHTGVVLSGHGVVLYDTGERLDLLPGQAFHITSTPHDSWVEGDEPYVSLHLLGMTPPP